VPDSILTEATVNLNECTLPNTDTSLKTFLDRTLDQTTYLGKFSQSLMSRPADWLQIPAMAAEWSANVAAVVSKTGYCSYNKGYKITIHYSFALSDAKRMYYIIKIEKTLVTGELVKSSIKAEFGIYIDYVFHSPQVKDPDAFTEKYGSGLIGAVNYFFTEVILPVLQPSSVRVS